MSIDILQFGGGFLVGMAVTVACGLYIVLDEFGAPHARKKYWFEFWRSK